MLQILEDTELGTLNWNDQLRWWEGSIQLSAEKPFTLFVFARPELVAERGITDNVRESVFRIRDSEFTYRRWAATRLLNTYNAEWSDGRILSAAEFSNRMEPDSVEVHESGYTEIHFQDGGLFDGHGIGVRVRPDGSCQEVVVEG